MTKFGFFSSKRFLLSADKTTCLFTLNENNLRLKRSHTVRYIYGTNCIVSSKFIINLITKRPRLNNCPIYGVDVYETLPHIKSMISGEQKCLFVCEQTYQKSTVHISDYNHFA